MALLLWAVGIILVVVTVWLVAAKWRRKGSEYRLNAGDCHQEIAAQLTKVLPLHSARGWALHSVRNGLRVFERPMKDIPRPHPPRSAHQSVLAASLVLDMSVKRSLALVCYVKELSNWFPGCVPQTTSQLADSSSSPRQLIQFDYSLPQTLMGSWYRRGRSWCGSRAPRLIKQLLIHLPPPPPTSGRVVMEQYHHDQSSDGGGGRGSGGGGGRGSGGGCGRGSGGGGCYIFSYFCPPSHLPYIWSCLFLAPLREEGTTLASLVVCPGNTSCAAAAELLSGQLCALREYVTMRRFKVYSSLLRGASLPSSSSSVTHSVSSSLQSRPTNSLPTSLSASSQDPPSSSPNTTSFTQEKVLRRRDVQTRPSESHTTPTTNIHGVSMNTVKDGWIASGNSDEFSIENTDEFSVENTTSLSSEQLSEPSSEQVSQNFMSTPENSIASASLPSLSPSEAGGGLDAHYIEMAKDMCEGVLATAGAGEEQGWVSLGTNKDVAVMKKPPAKGELVSSLKGTGLIKAPPEFLLRLLVNPENALELDDMLKEEKMIYSASPTIHLVHLIYKGIWPTSARDFSLLSVSGKLTDTTWISVAKSVVDDRIPELKGHVRGQLDFGGYVIESIPGDPEQSVVTYAARVDLKGNIPMFVVNKVAETQPLCVNGLRKMAEVRYPEMKAQPQKLREFEEQFPIPVLNQHSKDQPSGGKTQQLSSGGTQQSSNGVTQQPSNGVTQQPSNGGTQQPFSGGTQQPSSGGTQQPSSGGTQQPSSGGTQQSSLPSTLQERLQSSQWHFDPSPVPPSSRETDLTATVLLEKPPDGLLDEEEDRVSTKPRVENDFDEEEDRVSTKPRVENDFATPVESEDELDGSITTDIQENIQQHHVGLSAALDDREELAAAGQNLHSGQSLGPGMQLPQTGQETTHEAKKRAHSDSHTQSGDWSPMLRTYSLDSRIPNSRDSRASPSNRHTLFNGRSSTPDSATRQQDLHSVTKDSIHYPRNDSGEVDYRTLANQTAAHVLEELFHVSNVDICDPSTFTDQSGGWKFEGVDKDIVILSKDRPDLPYCSFIGRGLIPLSPTLVFDSLRNPQLRFTYDNMLKELHVVQEMEKGLFILHVHHQTTQCFIKQSRDFSILVSERSEHSKKLLVATSIETPACPPNPGIYRGKVYCSGWVVQPLQVKGRLYADVTYILQVDLGRGVPKTIMNLISRRQPLAVAYLRDYLVSTSLENSVHT